MIETNPEQKLVFLHSIMHQEMNFKSVLKMNHVTHNVTKIGQEHCITDNLLHCSRSMRLNIMT